MRASSLVVRRSMHAHAAVCGARASAGVTSGRAAGMGSPGRPGWGQSSRRGPSELRARAEPKGETETESADEQKKERTVASTLDDLGLSLGPIGLTVGESVKERPVPSDYDIAPLDVGEIDNDDKGYLNIESIHSLTTEEWLEKFDLDGTVDLWLEDEYNAASRVPGGRAYGTGTGEAKTASTTKYAVKIVDPLSGETLDVEVPDDR